MRINGFQTSVALWMGRCFGYTIATDKQERNYRFIEEANELIQALGCTREDAHKLVDYVFNRPVGAPAQEVGGVMVTLAALCTANYLSMEGAATDELTRIFQPEVMEKIRRKQASKPQRSPLPEHVAVVEGFPMPKMLKKWGVTGIGPMTSEESQVLNFIRAMEAVWETNPGTTFAAVATNSERHHD